MLEIALLYTDGASRGNPGEAAFGYRILSANGMVLEEHAERMGRATNNQAEYGALLAGLSGCARLAAARVHCHSDSELMIRQLRGEYRVKDRLLRVLGERAKELMSLFTEVSFICVPRSHPEIAQTDALVNRVLDESTA